MDFEQWIEKEKQSVSDIAEEMKGVESKILDYTCKRIKEKFPESRVEKKPFSIDSRPLEYMGPLSVITYETVFADDKRVIEFVERVRSLEGVYSDEDPAERHIKFDPVYTAMIKEHEALKVNYTDRNTLLVHAAEYKDQRAWLEAKVVHKTELKFQAKQIQDKLADLEISINSHMEDYSRGKDAYEKLHAEYSDARG